MFLCQKIKKAKFETTNNQFVIDLLQRCAAMLNDDSLYRLNDNVRKLRAEFTSMIHFLPSFWATISPLCCLPHAICVSQPSLRSHRPSISFTASSDRQLWDCSLVCFLLILLIPLVSGWKMSLLFRFISTGDGKLKRNVIEKIFRKEYYLTSNLICLLSNMVK